MSHRRLAGVPTAWPLCLVSHALRSPPHSRSCGQAAGTHASCVDRRQLIPLQPLHYHTAWPPRSRTPLPGAGREVLGLTGPPKSTGTQATHFWTNRRVCEPIRDASPTAI